MSDSYEKLTDKEKKTSKIVSRIIGILIRIGNIACWIGAVCVLIVSMGLGILLANTSINTEAKTIKIFGDEKSYVIEDQEFSEVDDGVSIDVTVKNKNARVILKDEEKGAEFVFTVSEKVLTDIENFISNDAMKASWSIVISFFISVFGLVFVALTLGHIASIFKNIAKEDTPFVEDNVTRLEKVLKYSIIAFAIGIIANIVLLIVFPGNVVTINTGSISGVLIAYVALYVFKSGFENSTKKTTKKAKVVEAEVEEEDEE